MPTNTFIYKLAIYELKSRFLRHFYLQNKGWEVPTKGVTWEILGGLRMRVENKWLVEILRNNQG